MSRQLPFKFSLILAIAAFSTPVTAADICVSPQGSDRNSGTSSDSPIQTIQLAVDKAQPGDTINLAPGTYLQDIVTKKDGTQSQPISITGSADAVIKGGGKARIIEVNHSHIIINGFTVDGLHGRSDTAKGYRDKLIYVQGKGNKSGVEGLKIINMILTNAGGECIRLRYFVNNSEIGLNTIKNCGVRDFKIEGMKNGKNGEGIYVGTAPEQTGDGKNPTSDPDRSSNNWIHHNTINTQANECVEIKEWAKDNTIEKNFCTGQKDPNSAGISIRGNNNTIRFNVVEKTIGSAIRLGGDTPNDGVNNNVYGNSFKDTSGGGIKFQVEKQGIMCENSINSEQEKVAVGNFSSLFSPTDICTSIEK